MDKMGVQVVYYGNIQITGGREMVPRGITKLIKIQVYRGEGGRGLMTQFNPLRINFS